MPTGILQKGTSSNANAAQSSKPKKDEGPRLKVVIRRLPPGLTENEYQSCVGSEWVLGQGKVDHYVWRSGKVSADPSKPSRPSRVYLHLTDENNLNELAEKVRTTSFADAKNTTRDPALLGPPTLDFAPHHRIHAGRKRKDQRAGTIDQDPDFRAFLESLTNPIPKATLDLDSALHRAERATSTPLIDHLRERKHAKDKPASKAAAKHGRGEGRDSIKDKKKGKDASVSTTEKGKKSSKTDKVAKEAVKVLNREANAASSAAESSASSAAAPAERKRERARPFNVAAKIQQDLGIGPAANRRASRREKLSEATSSPASEKQAGGSSEPANAPTSGSAKAPTPAKTPRREPRSREKRGGKEPVKDEAGASADSNAATSTAPSRPTILKKGAAAPSGPLANAPAAPKGAKAQASAATSSSSSAAPSQSTADKETSTSSLHRAFLKHANPSQGITEPLIQEILSQFGPVSSVDLDKRKGFAYVDFADAGSLQKAVKAGKIDIAKGAVQVLEFKERGAAASRAASATSSAQPNRGSFRGRGGRGRGRAGSAAGGASTSIPSPAAPTT
jgi:regulator of nonsense transcripts 3